MNWRKIILNQKSIWIYLGLLSILASATLSPSFIEEHYSKGIFLFIRKILSTATGWLPFAFVYLLFFLLLFLLIKWIVKFVRKKQSTGKKWLNLLWSLLAFAGGVVFVFQFLWGFNYGRIPLEEQLKLDVKPLDVKELKTELDLAITGINTYRPMLEGVTEEAVPSSLLMKNVEQEMRQLLKENLKEFGYPTPADVRGRLLHPQGLLLRISTAGVYIPFTGEGHIDPGLHHLQLPFVMAHEMSHAYGIGGEGDCNFLAYLTCLRSDDPYLRYVGHLYYFRYVAPDYRAYKPEEYKKIWAEIPQGVKNDLKAIREQMDKFPDIFPKIRDAAYNTYLKAQGIDDGIKNYDRVTMLAHAWHKKNKKN